MSRATQVSSVRASTRIIDLLEAVVTELRTVRALLEAGQVEAARDEAPPASDPDELLEPQVVASLLGMNVRTFRRLRRTGDAPKELDVGGRPRWKRSTVNAWLATRGAT